METLKMILTFIFIVICVALIILILAQEAKSTGLGALAGSSETYWSKNKGRSAEGLKKKATTILVVAFILLAIVLNLGIF